jgi:hypothetical protein
METSVGKTIDLACQILLRTYREINRLTDDLVDLTSEYDPAMKFAEEYSYGGKSLYLRANHTFLLKAEPREEDEAEKKESKKQRVLALVCIFYDDGGLNRISLKDEPELWIGLLDINNSKENCRPMGCIRTIEGRGTQSLQGWRVKSWWYRF